MNLCIDCEFCMLNKFSPELSRCRRGERIAVVSGVTGKVDHFIDPLTLDGPSTASHWRYTFCKDVRGTNLCCFEQKGSFWDRVRMWLGC